MRPGTRNSQTTTRVIELRTAIAPTVPQMMADFCKRFGTWRTASAITMALSPASTRSMTTMAASAAKNSDEKSSMAIALSREPLADIDTVCRHACVLGNILCPGPHERKLRFVMHSI